jgi:GLPGLI family protein
MKYFVSIILAHLVVLLANGQMKEGKIIYERKINLHKRIPAADESMKSMIPEFNTSKVQLLFSESESIFKNLPEEEDIREHAGESDNGNRIVMRFGGSDDETYKNYETGKSIEQRELGPKKYIIEDSLKKLSWKLDDAGSTKMIKNYTCRKALCKSPQGLDVVAWYSDEINCPSGPDIYGGLPGMILEVSIGDGEIVFTPIEITNSTDKKLVKAPVSGKKISRKEFQKMIEEQFGANPGGGPVIRIQRDVRAN